MTDVFTLAALLMLAAAAMGLVGGHGTRAGLAILVAARKHERFTPFDGLFPIRGRWLRYVTGWPLLCLSLSCFVCAIFLGLALLGVVLTMVGGFPVIPP